MYKIILPVCAFLILTGAAFYKTSLKNTDSSDPLVNLGVIISSGGNYLTGDTGAENNASDEETEDSSDTDEADVTSDGSETAAQPENAVIEVYGDRITYNGYEKDLNRILVYIDSCASKGTHMEFHVEYADYRILSAIRDHLIEKNITGYDTDYDLGRE